MNDNQANTRDYRSGKFFLLFSLLLTAIFAGCSWPLQEKGGEVPGTASYCPRVYIHPASADLSEASIAVPPFRIPPDVETIKGEEVAALFQKTLLGERVFRKVKLIPSRYGSLEEAMELARARDVNLVLAGEVNHALSGSNLGGGRLNVSLRVIDLASSDTVWYIEQTVHQDMAYPDNSLLHRLSRIFSPPPVPEKGRAPAIPVMLTRISRDISRIIKSGRYAHPYPGSP